MKSKRGRKAKRKAPLPLSKGDFVPECIVDKIDLRESCNQVCISFQWRFLCNILLLSIETNSSGFK